MAGSPLIFGDVATATAAGTTLAHSILVDVDRWPKGRVLTAADAARAAAAGIAMVTVVSLGPDDVAEDTAAATLAAALTGTSVAAAPAAHGRVNLIAAANGLLRVDAAAVGAVNAVDEGLTLGTLAHGVRVAAGDVVATVKVIPFAVREVALAAAVAAATPLALDVFTPRRFVLIQTRLAATADKMLARTDAVTRARVAAIGGTLDHGWIDCAHATNALVRALDAAARDAVLLIAGASATADRRDVIPAAIVAAGGRVERLGMPVDPGNLLCLGALGGRAVIGLPGCARSPKRNGFDWVLERLAAGIATSSADIAAMGVGGLLPEAERPQPRLAGGVGAIVLAAGRSTRMGANKLLADLDGKPVIAHVVDAIGAAGLPPPVVVVGHMAAEVRAAIGDRQARYVFAADHLEGMSRSLRAGLAAVPDSWRAALVVLGDMPRITATTLAALAASASAATVAAPVWRGARGNPVAWGRSYWPQLMTIDGDVGGKALLADVDVVEVAADGDGVLADVDTPEALAALRRG